MEILIKKAAVKKKAVKKKKRKKKAVVVIKIIKNQVKFFSSDESLSKRDTNVNLLRNHYKQSLLVRYCRYKSFNFCNSFTVKSGIST